MGTEMPLVGNLKYQEAEKTVLLFVRSTCKYCTASMPFYRELANRIAQKGVNTRLVIVGPEDEAVTKEYLDQHELSVFHVLKLGVDQSSAFGVLGTPTMVVVGRDGKLLASWRGQLPKEREREVERVLLGT